MGESVPGVEPGAGAEAVPIPEATGSALLVSVLVIEDSGADPSRTG